MALGRFDKEIKPDYESFLKNLRREGTPDRVHYMELFLDGEIQNAICQRFGVGEELDKNDPHYGMRRYISLQRFLGYDEVAVGIGGLNLPLGERLVSEDVTNADTRREGGRGWLDESKGIIANMEDFERYPWPDPKGFTTDQIEWAEKNAPDDMCLRAGCHNVFEYVTWLMGYEQLCYAIHDQPELVDALFERVGSLVHEVAKVIVQFDRIEILFGGDDMGFRTGTMVGPNVLIEKSFPWHKKNAELAHQHGKLYLLHACGNLEAVMPALIEDVQIDGRHSFEDVIEPVTEAKKRWGDRIAVIGGIDVDFLCRATEEQVRQRVRETLDICMPGGGYCLGSGNSVANYVPVDNYLAMMDEGRRWASG